MSLVERIAALGLGENAEKLFVEMAQRIIDLERQVATMETKFQEMRRETDPVLEHFAQERMSDILYDIVERNIDQFKVQKAVFNLQFDSLRRPFTRDELAQTLQNKDNIVTMIITESDQIFGVFHAANTKDAFAWKCTDPATSTIQTFRLKEDMAKLEPAPNGCVYAVKKSLFVRPSTFDSTEEARWGSLAEEPREQHYFSTGPNFRVARFVVFQVTSG